MNFVIDTTSITDLGVRSMFLLIVIKSINPQLNEEQNQKNVKITTIGSIKS